ncbi:hypothetical protein BDAP_002866 [Binucleata daphniae]
MRLPSIFIIIFILIVTTLLQYSNATYNNQNTSAIINKKSINTNKNNVTSVRKRKKKIKLKFNPVNCIEYARNMAQKDNVGEFCFFTTCIELYDQTLSDNEWQGLVKKKLKKCQKTLNDFMRKNK